MEYRQLGDPHGISVQMEMDGMSDDEFYFSALWGENENSKKIIQRTQNYVKSLSWLTFSLFFRYFSTLNIPRPIDSHFDRFAVWCYL